MSNIHSQQGVAAQNLNAAIAAWDAQQNKPMANFYKMITSGAYSDPASHNSKFYKQVDEAVGIWSRPRFLIGPKQKYTAIRIAAEQARSASQDDYDHAARCWYQIALDFEGFIDPLGFDCETNEWLFAFREKTDAMLFKLAHGGS